MRRSLLAIIVLAFAASARAEAPPAQILNIPYVEDTARGLVTLQTQHLELLIQLINAQAAELTRLKAQRPAAGECI